MSNEPEHFSRPNEGVCHTRTAQAALDVLLNADFEPLKIPEYYERLADELGRDFANIRFVAQFVPLLHSGPKHRELRRQGAIFLRSRAAALAAFERQAADLFAMKLRQPGQVEVVSEIINPLFNLAAKGITGLPYFPDVLRVFTAYNSLKMSHKIDADFARLRKIARRQFPEDSADTHGLRIAFSVLGIDPLGASLAKSFAALLKDANTTPIRALKWGKHYAATGLSVVGREGRNGPVDLGKGVEAVRLCEIGLEPFLDAGAQPSYIFGAGVHACLGRNTALSLWSRIGAELAESTLQVRLLKTTPSTHKILDYPSEILIEILP